TGNLRIVQEDLFLPGKGGLDLHILRTYSSKIWGRSDHPNVETLLADKEPTVIGFGWSLHMGRLRSPNFTPGSPGLIRYPVYEGADGTSHVFYPTSGTTKFVSRDFWTLDTDCVITVGTGRGGCITTTNGQHVEFAKSNQYQLDNGVDVIWPLS